MTPARTDTKHVVGRRRAALTLADQLVSSASNFLLGVLIARAGGADALGAFGVAFLVWLAVVGISRAVITEPMTVAGTDKVDGREMREGLLACVTIGAAAALVLAVSGVVVNLLGGSAEGVLGLAPWLPGLLAQDFFRSVAFRGRRPDRALYSDVMFAAVQGLLTAGLFLLDQRGVVPYLAAWGCGATAGAVLAVRQAGVTWGLRGGVSRLRALWPRSRWFLAEFSTSFPADQGYLLLLPVLLGTAQFGVYRAGASLIGPVVVVFLASGNLGLPECVSRLRSGGMAGLASYAPRLTLAVLAVTVVYCAAVAIFAGPILALAYGPVFAPAELIVRLVAGQYVMIALGFGAGVAMKAANQVRQLWMLRVLSAVVSITSVLVLTAWFGLAGAGLASIAAGAAYTGGVTIGYRRMRRQLLNEQAVVPQQRSSQQC